jgi:hypothetical protein
MSAKDWPLISAKSLTERGLVLKSVQLALARQDVKEREASDDIRSRSDDSYSPRRHWCPV